MADNEERIRVFVLKNPCEKCDIKPCTRKCAFRTLFEKAPGITRQEAIEIMGDAVDRSTLGTDSRGFIYAEVMLDALLERCK